MQAGVIVLLTDFQLEDKVNKSSSKPTLIPNKNYFAAFARTVNGLRAKYSSMT